MGHPSVASLPRSSRRRLTHRAGTPRGAILRLSALAGALGRIRDDGGRPAAWGVQPTDDDVVTILAHLVPIRTRAALAASYAREGRRLLDGVRQPASPGQPAAEPVDAIDLAYALRWIELEDARARL
jgi:hypothetical protein